MKIPDRWLNYKNSGRIPGTRFVAFKAPVRENYSSAIPSNKSFTPEILIQNHPDIKLVVDLTFTKKYYHGKKEFEEKGIKYAKINCRGHKIPDEKIFEKFVEVVDEFLATNPEDFLIGVHCLHGVNRTGYFIVRYMIEKLGLTAAESFRVFIEGRGHAIERTEYLADLFQRDTKGHFQKHRLNEQVSS